MLVIIVALVVVLAILGAAVAFLLMQPAAEEAGAEGAESSQAAQAEPRAPKTPPEFMALDSMVVNLADPGGMRFAQVGLTLQVADAATAETVKAFMPAIRNGMLRQISRRTAEELLRPEGKDQLAADLLTLVREQAGLPEIRGYSPVEAVLFASLIVQ